jgi:hypothetical protein
MWLRIPIAALLFLSAMAIIPRWWCGREGLRWYDGDTHTVYALARDVAATAQRGVSVKDFTNDDPLFKGEWQFGTYQMTALSLLQIIRTKPEFRDEFLPAIETSIDRMLSPEVRAFDTAQWAEDALASLDGANAHAAYLGYLNVVLGMHRRIVPTSRFSELNDRISQFLDRRLIASPHGILQTYPSEAYPMDNVCVVASLILHAKNTGADHSEALKRPLANLRDGWIDPSTGLLYQAVNARTGLFIESARASGTAFASTILSFAESDISARLYQAVKRHCAASLCGFGFVNEYPHGKRGHGDVDSGPLIFGISPSGTAFSLGAARAHGDRDTYVSLYRTAHLMGTPTDFNGRRTYVTGGPLGNAILLAMLTAQLQQP